MDSTTSLRLIQDEVKKNLKKAFNNLKFLMLKVRQMEELIDDPRGTSRNVQMELESDLAMLKLVLMSVNLQCDQVGMNLNSPRYFIDEENKWFNFPQYPPPDLSVYVPGYRIKGAVSYIKDQENGLFYLLDFNRSPGISNVFRMLLNGTDTKPIHNPNVLESGDMIAIKTDGQFARAIIQFSKQSDWKLLLIDIGEELEYEETMELYEIADYYKHIPAQGILCTADSLAEKYLHQNIEVEVVNVKYNVIHVRLEPKFKTSKANDTVSDISETQSINTNTTKYSSTNPFATDLIEMYNNSMKISDDDCNSTLNSSENDQEIDDFLKDTEVGTSNAMVAVMGYDPKDESRYCKHYDEKTGGCFKGANCKFLHQKPLEDGWTRDQVLVTVELREKVLWPNIHDKLSIEMSCCLDVDAFYGYILNPEFHRSTAISLNALNREINMLERITKYKRFKQFLPAEGELVLAPYQLSHYRARVISVAQETVDVFFVDYGNISEVATKDLYVWEDQFGKIPFQAIKFKIAGISPNKCKSLDLRVSALYKLLTNKTLLGVVIGNSHDILVRLYDSNGNEVMESLKLTGVAETLENLDVQMKKPEFIPV